jgi:GNAT superfamily N-acetyltransferase
VLVIGTEIAGFSRVSTAARTAEIEELHIRPRWIGQGYGRVLFEHLADRARERGALKIRWSTDQHSLGFYERMGGRVIGTEPSGIAGDDPLTLMELPLAAKSNGGPGPA